MIRLRCTTAGPPSPPPPCYATAKCRPANYAQVNYESSFGDDSSLASDDTLSVSFVCKRAVDGERTGTGVCWKDRDNIKLDVLAQTTIAGLSQISKLRARGGIGFGVTI